MIRLALALIFGLAFAAASGRAQTPVWTVPQPATTKGGNASSTITATSTFQLVFATTVPASSSGAGVVATRRGCTIVNNGTHNMQVTEGLGVAASTAGLSVTLLPGQAYYCAAGGTVLTGEIDITGTIGDAFYAAQY